MFVDVALRFITYRQQANSARFEEVCHDQRALKFVTAISRFISRAYEESESCGAATLSYLNVLLHRFYNEKVQLPQFIILVPGSLLLITVQKRFMQVIHIGLQ